MDERERLTREMAALIEERDFADRRCAELEAKVAGLQGQLAAMDAENASLILKIVELRRRVHQVQPEAWWV